jgi:MFS family permease
MLVAVASARQRIGDSGAAFASVFANRNLRSLELAWGASILGNWAFLVAVSVYAYGIGGETAVGVLLMLRLVPAGLIAPFAGVLADRYPRERVLLISNLVRICSSLTASVCVFLDAPAVSVLRTRRRRRDREHAIRSAQAALTPTLARSPSELTAANAVASTFESIAAFAGPAIAGLMLVALDIGSVFAVTAGLVAVSTIFVLRIRVESRPLGAGSRLRPSLRRPSQASERSRGIGSSRTRRALHGADIRRGAVQVFLVITAIELLNMGDAGVGYLNSAVGVGALIEAFSRSRSPGRSASVPPSCSGSSCGGPLIVLGLTQSTIIALVVFALLGVGNSLVDVAAFTLVQRAVPDEVLARVFGVIQMLWLASVGIGAVAADPDQRRGSGDGAHHHGRRVAAPRPRPESTPRQDR